ncbi:MAG TPA: hypothetical protein PLN21_10660 [Gemmatales bacterium]|nr:hypothetical protein [Gemmatales bacterium]
MRSLHFDMETLSIEMQGEGFEFAKVLFHAPAGFRVLDERDLCEFWDKLHYKNGWLFEVEEGGWLELERQRQLFNSHEVHQGMKEYLVVCDQCVSVFSVRPPEIIDIGAEPKWPGP